GIRAERPVGTLRALARRELDVAEGDLGRHGERRDARSVGGVDGMKREVGDSDSGRVLDPERDDARADERPRRSRVRDRVPVAVDASKESDARVPLVEDDVFGITGGADVDAASRRAEVLEGVPDRLERGGLRPEVLIVAVREGDEERGGFVETLR